MMQPPLRLRCQQGPFPCCATEKVRFLSLSASSYIGLLLLPAGRRPGEMREFLLQGSGKPGKIYDHQCGFVSLDPWIQCRSSATAVGFTTTRSTAASQGRTTSTVATMAHTCSCGLPNTPTGTAWPSLDQQPGTARPGQISAAAVWHGSNRSPTPWVVSPAGQGHRLAGRAKWCDRIWLHAINPKLYTQ